MCSYHHSIIMLIASFNMPIASFIMSIRFFNVLIESFNIERVLIGECSFSAHRGVITSLNMLITFFNVLIVQGWVSKGLETSRDLFRDVSRPNSQFHATLQCTAYRFRSPRIVTFASQFGNSQSQLSGNLNFVKIRCDLDM